MGTGVKLSILGYIAGIDILSISCIYANSIDWNIHPYFVHNNLAVPVACEPIFKSQKLCLIHHRINRVEGNEHLDSLYIY